MPSLRSVAEACLRIHGVGVRVRSDEPAALEAITRDFAYFSSAEPLPAATITVAIHAQAPPPELSGPGPWWPGRGLRWREEGGARLVRYDGGELVRWSQTGAAGDVYGQRPHRLHELAYLLILSRVGERLDGAGLHRVHALGFEHRGRGGLVLLPSGGGKTSLSLALRGTPGLRFLSEDTPLVDGQGNLLAFPLRWGLRSPGATEGIPDRWLRPFHRERFGPKWLVDVGYFEGLLAQRAPARWLFVGGRDPRRPAGVRPIDPARAAGALALNLVVGWGVPQMAEYALSARAAPTLASAALKRAAAALRLLRTAQSHRLELGRSPQDGARALRAFLESA